MFLLIITSANAFANFYVLMPQKKDHSPTMHAAAAEAAAPAAAPAAAAAPPLDLAPALFPDLCPRRWATKPIKKEGEREKVRRRKKRKKEDERRRRKKKKEEK